MEIKYRVVFERKNGNTGSSRWFQAYRNAVTEAIRGQEEGLTILWIENSLGERI